MDLADDPRRFSVALRGGDKLLGIPNLFEELLFIDADAEQAAEQVFALPPDRWHTFLLPFKERIERQEYLASKRNDGRPTEKEWLEHFRRSALSLASAASPLRRSQMHIALTSLGFLDAQPSDGPVAE
jgi:hypothetical protein